MNENAIDWNEVWKQQHLRRIGSNCSADCSRLWDKKEEAQRFWKMSQENNAERIRNTIEGLALTPHSRLLDIGAGPGTLTIPIARQMAHVSAVEPSEGMMAVLRDNIEDEQIQNILCVQKRWEDVDIQKDLEAPYDVVMASYSLGMADIGEAIQKMVDASSKYVYLYWFAGETSWDRQSRALWPALHDGEYYPEPKCDVLYNALYQMGIYPNIEVFPFQHVIRFTSLEEAVEYSRSQYKVTNDVQESILRDYLESVFEEEEDGSLIQWGSSIRVRMWWEKEPGLE